MTKQASIQIPVRPAIKRSHGWTKLRRDHLKQQPTCQACGKSTGLAVHHIIPLHVDRSKELDPENLITLCENVHSAFCHYTFGHLGISWWKWDSNVVADAKVHLQAIQDAQITQDKKGNMQPGVVQRTKK